MATAPVFVNPLNNLGPVNNVALANGLDLSKPAAAPLTVEDLYTKYTGGAGDAGGLAFWKAGFGDKIDDNEVASFQRSVAEARAQGTEPLTRATTQPAYFQANPDVAAAYANRTNDPNLASTVNMTPEQFAAAHYQNYGTKEQRAAPVGASMAAAPVGASMAAAPAASATDFDKLIRDAYAGIGRTGIGTEASTIDQAGYDAAMNALKTGAVSVQDFDKTFKNTVADYLAQHPEDKYSTYVADYLQKNKNQDIAGVQQLYQEVLGRDADAGGLGNWYKQFGSEISADERAQFEQSAKGELDTRVKDLYTDFLGRTADDEGLDYWRKQFGSRIDDAEREQFRQSAATEVNKQFGVTDPATAPTTEGILSGFKYIKDSGINEDKLKKTLGEDVFNTYKAGFSDYAKTGIANVLADKKLSFDEAREQVKFGRDYGYDSQKLADLTGQKKELFDTINKTYDDTTNKIVDSVLGAEDVKTDGDRVVRSLALQQKYGFTDEDLAKAADYDVKKLKADLDPVRNYESDYKNILSKPDASGSDILKFLESSKNNEGIGRLYGANIDTRITQLNELNDKWKDYKVDGFQAEKIYDRIGNVNKTLDNKTWTGSWMGGGDNAAKEAAALLVKRGVDDLSDLKMEKSYEKTPAKEEFYNGQRVFTTEDGRKYTVKTVSYGGDDVQNVTEFLPKDAKTIPGYLQETYDGGDGAGQYLYTPKILTEAELKTFDPKTGKFDKDIGNKLIDKSTGKVIGTSADNKFTLDYYDTGNFFKGKDKSFGVMMTDKGVPVPYQTTERSGLVYSPVFPIIASMLLPGIGSSLSAALPGAGVAASGATAAIAPTLMNTALTQGILGGGMAALTGQNILKGALLGGIGAPISAGIGSLMPSIGLDAASGLGKAVTSAGTGVVKGALQGGDFGDLLGQGVLSGLTNYGFGEATKGLNLTPQQLNFATGIALPLIQGQKVNPMNLIGSLAKTAQQQTTKATP